MLVAATVTPPSHLRMQLEVIIVLTIALYFFIAIFSQVVPWRILGVKNSRFFTYPGGENFGWIAVFVA